MLRRKMTEQELRLECAKLSIQGYKQFIPEVADEIYNYITSKEESKVSQTKPHEHFYLRLWSKFQRLLKQP